MSFAGIPIIVDKYMPADELWMIRQGRKSTIHVHEGPRAGEDVEIWLTKPRVIRVVNLGDSK